MTDKLLPCSLCGGEAERSDRPKPHEPVVVCNGDRECPLYRVLLTETVWQSLPRPSTTAREIAAEMRDRVRALKRCDAPGQDVLRGWATRLESASPGVPAEVWVLIWDIPGGRDCAVHATEEDAYHAANASAKPGKEIIMRTLHAVPVHGVPAVGECEGCSDVWMVAAKEAATKRDEYKARVRIMEATMLNPDETWRERYIDERTQRETAEKEVERLGCLLDISREGRENDCSDCYSAATVAAMEEKLARYLRACKRMHREWRTQRKLKRDVQSSVGALMDAMEGLEAACKKSGTH